MKRTENFPYEYKPGPYHPIYFLISLLKSVTPTGPLKGQPLDDLDFHGDADHPTGAAAGDSMSQVDRVFKSTSGYGSKRGNKNMKRLAKHVWAISS